MSEPTTAPLRAALAAATRSGLLLVYPGAPAWTRLACPSCGGALDLPLPPGGPPDGPPGGPDPADTVRRVDAFAHRHRPGRAHR